MRLRITIFLASLAFLLLLAGCTFPSAQQLATIVATAATKTPTPSLKATEDNGALPTKEDVADWLLTTTEIKYIQAFRFFKLRWFPMVDDSLYKVYTEYQNDPAVLMDNQWRVQLADVVSNLSNASLYFEPASPSTNFNAIAQHAELIVHHLSSASNLLSQAIDENDGDKILAAGREVDAARAKLNAIDEVFTHLIGPPEK